MHMSPAEILGHLGFDIPAEGITINPYDAFLTVSALRLVAELINVDQIPDPKLVELHCVWVGMGAAKSGQATPTSAAPNAAPSEKDLLMLRGYLRGVLRVSFGRKA